MRSHQIEMRPLSSQMLLAAAVVVACLPSLTSAQLLQGHSLIKADAAKLAAEWYMAGQIVPTVDSIILSPGVPQRIGAFWSSTPLLTNDFEVTLKIKGSHPPVRHTKDGGFALWYVHENGTNVHSLLFETHAQNQEKIQAYTWPQDFAAAGCDLLGWKSTFDGLGVIFLDEETGPSVSPVPNDGRQSWKLGAGVPSPNAVKTDFLNGQETTVKVSVKASQATVEVPGQPPVTVNGAFRSGGYLGFTSFGGTKLTPESEEKSFSVELLEMQVINNDRNAKGEEVKSTPAPAAPVPEDEKVDVIAEASSFKDHRQESDAIKDLTNVVFKLVVETQPIRHQMERAIASLAKRIDLMETNFNELKAELDKKTGHHLATEFEAIKQELTTLSDVASKETQDRHSRLESLHHDIADVHKSAHSPDNIDKHLDKLSASNDKVLDQLTNEHQTMFGVSLAAIAFIVIAGLSLYNKFRCWEKKHVL